MQNIQNFDWTCPSCISTLRTLPFADISNLYSSDGSFTSHGDDSCTEPASQQTLASEDYLENLSRILNYSSKDLRVAHLNMCSLRYKIDELRLLQRICGFDILGISETHLDSSVPDNFLQIDGLQLIRRDRTKCKGGGVALYYADHLTAVHRKDLLVKDIEAIWIQVKFPVHTTLFSVVYRSELETPNFFENFHGVLEKAWLKTDSIFVLGDLNCCMLEAQNNPGSTLITSKTKNLLRLFEDFNMQNVIAEPTCITYTTKSLIDLIVTTKVDVVRCTGVMPLGISDHCLVYATLKLGSKRPPPKIIRTRNFKNFNAANFKADIEKIPFHILEIFHHKDDALWEWELLFKDICNAHAPFKDVKVRSMSAPWINNTIRHNMNRRFKLFKEANRTKDPSKWAAYKKLRNEITADIRRAKAKHFKDLLADVKTTAEYWNLLSKANNPKLRKAIGPLKREDGSLAVDDKEKSNLVNNFFSNIGEKLAGSFQPQYPSDLATSTKIVPCVNNIALLPLAIERKLANLKTNKATGPDDISPKIVKEAGDALLTPLMFLCNMSLKDGYVFSQWKTARVNPVFKKDDETEIGNYRPISLLSVPSKILETIVADSIIHHAFIENKLIIDKQWAYRRGYSTELLLVHMTEIWSAIDSNKVVGIVLVDFQKAFDCVSHNVLLRKLENDFGINGLLLDWLRSYLDNRKQYTVLNGIVSDLNTVKSGIPQGSVLGPTLFSLYTSDLPEAITTATTYMYADDTILYCIGDSIDAVISELNKALEELLYWCKTNSLVPHPKKCEAMSLHRGRFTGPLKELTLAQHTIKWVTHSRLSGVSIDDQLNWSQHVSVVKKGFVDKLNLLKRSRFLPKNMLLDLYFRVIMPSIVYGISVWGGLTNKEGFKALEALHCRAARIIFELPWEMSNADVMKKANSSSLAFMYKISLAKLMYKICNNLTPDAMSAIIKNNDNIKRYQLRKKLKIDVPRFNTNYMRNSVARRGAIVWNTLVPQLNDDIDNVKKYAIMARRSKTLLHLDFDCISPQTLTRWEEDFKYN